MKLNFATFIGSRDNEGVQKVEWGHVTWVCKGSQLALSTHSKTICAVLDVGLSHPYTGV